VLVDMENIPEGLEARRLVNATVFSPRRRHFELHSQIAYHPLVKNLPIQVWVSS